MSLTSPRLQFFRNSIACCDQAAWRWSRSKWATSHAHSKEMFGEQVSLTFYRRLPDTVALLLEDAGLTPYAGMVREPNRDGFESTPRAYLIARRT
jgi:hypothetical protein